MIEQVQRLYTLLAASAYVNLALVGKSLHRDNLGSYPGVKETCQPPRSEARV